ncbi:integrase catalytic domain-containing protein [Trichonephila clavipes]|nr:integrase catalytic domain-containing protein [Trichonephila clavipes]
MSDMYIDDVLTGAETLLEAKELKNQLINIFTKGGMVLHKWCGNNTELIEVSENYDFSDSSEIKVLDVYWNPKHDCFSFRVKIDLHELNTKRDVLSTIARIYDPLGLLGPVVAKAKIFLQKLWMLKIDWTDLLPDRINREWRQFVESLQVVNDININRCIVVEQPEVIELHGFSDASQSAYGAVVYCKSITSDGKMLVHLIASKSRVAPTKQTTIPRLELCAAVLLAKLMHRVKQALKLNVTNTFLWSDSMIVLSWIRKESYQLKTFVANRIATIQEMTSSEQWRYVATEDNPADFVSRGMDSLKLKTCELWWNGPKFLMSNQYPQRQLPVAVIKDPGKLKNCSDFSSFFLDSATNSFVNNLLNLSNDYFKIIRVLSFICRFVYNCKSKESKGIGPLDLGELKKAEQLLLKLVQKEEFKVEMNGIQNSAMVPSNSRVKTLNPFIDSEGILRVGGRLRNSDINYNQKFPILLPSKHKLTYLIVEHFHKKFLHSGPQSLLYQIRQNFWILNGRNICRKVVHNCVICCKANPTCTDQIMADLPKDRVIKNYPFNVSGVDFCVPFYIKYKGQRKGVYNKIYVCIFICFVSKAVHLDIVTDLTSNAFIATLKRFIFRRGKCAKLYSDNATNFVGANIELKKKMFNLVCKPDEALASYMASEGIDWKFLPPRAPNFGGLWEAGVKSFKFYLKRVVGNIRLTYEEFLTVIIQIEGMLNSRPLVPLSSDLDDLNVLTPSHFLIGRSITSIVEPDLTNLNENRLDNWQKITKIIQLIWKRWSVDYLNSLQQRNKWHFDKKNAKIGDMVIIKEDNLPSCQWSLGRINNIYPGKDSKVRVAEVKTTREAVTDLTTEAFNAALKRLCARRGHISTLMSDNATNFKGAAAELNRFIKLICNKNETLANYFASEAIQWKFIPPRSPNFGSLWEAGVKSFKHHLYRTLVNSKITFEEFETIIIQIEGILNSRPLVPLSDNINEYEVLTPGHFIIGRPISAIPEPAILDISDNRLSRWQYTTKCVQTIWKRWKNDYLNHLQQRNKWQFEKNNVAVGCLVLLKENDLPPYKWTMARILEVIYGTDAAQEAVSGTLLQLEDNGEEFETDFTDAESYREKYLEYYTRIDKKLGETVISEVPDTPKESLSYRNSN